MTGAKKKTETKNLIRRLNILLQLPAKRLETFQAKARLGSLLDDLYYAVHNGKRIAPGKISTARTSTAWPQSKLSVKRSSD